MLLFAFPGTGKTTLAEKYDHIIDLEMSEIKYDNTSVRHLSKEERKSVKRPLKSKDYKKDYTEAAMSYHKEGKVVLVALNFLLRLLWAQVREGKLDYHVVIPAQNLRKEYRRRYLARGNNPRFIREVMLIWSPTIWTLTLLSLFNPRITILRAGETLEDLYCSIRVAGFV